MDTIFRTKMSNLPLKSVKKSQAWDEEIGIGIGDKNWVLILIRTLW
jgi:hypothetical protein